MIDARALGLWAATTRRLDQHQRATVKLLGNPEKYPPLTERGALDVVSLVAAFQPEASVEEVVELIRDLRMRAEHVDMTAVRGVAAERMVDALLRADDLQAFDIPEQRHADGRLRWVYARQILYVAGMKERLGNVKYVGRILRKLGLISLEHGTVGINGIKEGRRWFLSDAWRARGGK